MLTRLRIPWVVAGALALTVVVGLIRGWWPMLGSAGHFAKPSKLVPRLGGAAASTWKYDLELSTDAELAGSKILGAHLQGRLLISPVESAGSKMLHVRLDHPDLQATKDGTDETVAAMRALQPQLGEAFACEIGSNGEVKQVWMRSGIDPLASRLLRTILVQSQVLVADHWSSRNAWEIDESDLTGVFRTSYKWQPAINAISKVKQATVRVHFGAGLGIRANHVNVDQSHGLARLDDSGSIVDLDYSEQLSMTLDVGGAEPIRSKSTTHLSLKNGAAVSDAPIVLAEVTRTARAPQAEEPQQARSEETDRQRMGSWRLPDVLVALRSIDRTTPEGRSDAARLFVAASTLFRRRPEALLQAKTQIQAKSEQTPWLLAALADSGNEQATAILTDALKNTQDTKIKRSALESMGRARPTGDALTAVQDLYTDREMGGLARLMSGAMAYNARESAPDVTRAAMDGLIQSLKTESRRLYMVDDLRALGNSGDARADQVAAQYITSTDPVIRAAAAQAVRRTNTPQAVDVLVQLSADPSMSVRSSALNAALDSQPSPPLVSAVEKLARLDSQESVRRDAVRALTNWKSKEPSVRETLAWVSTNDPNKEIRAVAEEGLGRFN